MSFVPRHAAPPAHARPLPPRRRSWGGLVVLLLYVALIGASEWRLQRQLAASTSVEFAPSAVVVDADPLPGLSD